MTNDLPALGLSFTQLFAILRARRLTVLVALALTVGATFVLTSVLPKTYTATADLFIDYPANDPLAGRQFSPLLDESYMQTQVDMIKSEEVASRVIDVTKLMARDGTKKSIEKDGETKTRSLLVERISKDLEVVLHKSSRVVELRYSSENANLSRDALNAAIQAYMDLALRISSAPAKSRQEQYSGQLETLRKELDTIQGSITEYQQKFGIIDADERLDTGSRQLNELSSKQTTIQGLRLEANSKHRAIEAMIRSGVPASEISEIAMQRGIPELRLRLADLERQMAEVGSIYGRNHPKFKIVTAERDILVQRLNRESQIALNAVLMEERRFDQQAHTLAAEIQEKQKRMLEMKQHRDVISSYQRQMESVQKIYNSAVQKYDELLMASTVNSPRLAVLRWGTAPYTHSKPKLITNLLMSFPVGILLGLGLIFLTELSGRRLRHVEDLERELNIDVLGRVGERSA
jgi:polysaccharide biosynthesis transport protein